MKSIVTINTGLPTVENTMDYFSGESLQDYDIAVFDPQWPWVGRIEMSDGSSIMSLNGTEKIQSAMVHWATEMKHALAAGKTVFIILNEHKTDFGTSGSTYVKGSRTYNTFEISNYDSLPLKIKVRNAKGQQILAADPAYRGMLETIKKIARYKVIVDPQIGKKILSTKDGLQIGAVVKIDDRPGNIVLLPFFDLFLLNEEGRDDWTDEDIKHSRAIVNQLLAVDKTLGQNDGRTPPPNWIETVAKPKEILDIEFSISKIDAKIQSLNGSKETAIRTKEDLLEFSHLLYENGKSLEAAIERSLKLIGYKTENFRSGDLEIDHVITSPEGIRMIGESEGKDTTAIDISKFRQLESNINEDFQREDVSVPAKGVLFGNGFRFTRPDKREMQFSQKCLINAKRLGTALVCTTDLYNAIVSVLNNPQDEAFKKACRDAIENAIGEVVEFPIYKTT
jgi:hypothetical protein